MNQKKLVAHRPKKMINGARFSISHFDIVFHLGVSQGKVPERNLAQAQALEMLGSVLAMAPVPVPPALVVLSGPGRAARFELPPPPSLAIIGRSKQADISLDDRDVSRRHAEVLFDEDKIVVKDLSSRSGILHNDTKAATFELAANDTFTVGGTTLALEHPLNPSLQHIQSAPEEDTASVCRDVIEELTIQKSDAAESAKTPDQTDDEFSDGQYRDSESPEIKLTELPTGPADPLVARDTSDYVKTQEMPIPPGEEKSDWGLIVVGAIVVITCVLVLVWLLA